LLWSYDGGRHAFFSSPAITAERVLFGGRDKQLHCARLSDGKPLWTFMTRRKVDGSPVVCGDKVVFGSGDGRVYMLRLADGEQVWSYEIGRSIFSSPAVADGVLITASLDGSVYAFGARPTPVEDDR
jgi:outer membrane protein assembly factor BamB